MRSSNVDEIFSSAIKFKTNKRSDLVINSSGLSRVLKYTRVPDNLLIDFINKVFNSESSIDEEFHTKDYLLTGSLACRKIFKDTTNKLIINVYSKFKDFNEIDYEKMVSFNFDCCFFEFNDEIYKRLSKSVSLKEHNYPYVLVSELNNEDSSVEIESRIFIPFSWLDENCENDCFDLSKDFKELAILNFENN